MAKIKVLKGKALDNIFKTSFHDGTIHASVSEVEKKLHIPFMRLEDGDGKVNYEADLSINGITTTIYDWKEGDIDRDTVIDLHIGTETVTDTLAVAEILNDEYGLNVKTSSPEANLLNAIFGSHKK